MFARPVKSIRRSIRQSIRRYLLDRMVLRPTRGPIDHGEQDRVMLDVAGEPLECFVNRNFTDKRPADLVVLKFPGTAGRAERSTLFPVSALSSIRGEVWTWNPPGYGGSHGRATLSNIAAAGQGFADAVFSRDDVKPKAVWLCGNSLGCLVSLHVASTLSPSSASVPVGLILRNPPPLVAVVKRIASRYPMARRVDPIAESLCDTMNAMMTAPQVHHPAVFLQSELDEIVPPGMQNEVIAAYAGDKEIVELAGLSHDGVVNDAQKISITAALIGLLQKTQT